MGAIWLASQAPDIVAEKDEPCTGNGQKRAQRQDILAVGPLPLNCPDQGMIVLESWLFLRSLCLSVRFPGVFKPKVQRTAVRNMRTLTVLLFILIADCALAQHEIFTEILTEHVLDGRVDYAAIAKDARLDAYLSTLAAADPDTIADNMERLAFWINAYNAYTLKVVSENYPVKSINDLHFGGLIIGTVLKRTVWHRKFAVVNGKALSLNNIEHDVIRKQFNEPRIHFALVCAAKSCPALRSEAYSGASLSEQLDDQAVKFFSNKKKNYFDPEKHVAHLSKIMDWYKDDFADNEEDLLRYVAQFLPQKLATSIRENPGEWHIKHTSYDWSLNE